MIDMLNLRHYLRLEANQRQSIFAAGASCRKVRVQSPLKTFIDKNDLESLPFINLLVGSALSCSISLG